MKKHKNKKKLSKPRVAELNATPKLVTASTKEPVALETLGLASQMPLVIEGHRD